MSSKKNREPEPCDYEECDDVSEVVQVVEAFIENNQTTRSLEVVQKDASGTDVLTVRITPK